MISFTIIGSCIRLQPTIAVVLFINMLCGIASAETVVRVRLETAAADGNNTPISRAELGEEFMLRAFVQDVRSVSPTVFGVFSAYIDVEYSSSAVSVVVPAEGPTIDHGTTYVNGTSGTISTAGLIDEAGGTDGLGPLGSGELLLWEVTFIADDLGTFDFVSNGAESPALPISVFGSNDPVPPSDVDFGTFSFASVLLGDMDFDFDDIDPFALGLSDPALYEATFGHPGSLHGDFDGDGDLDFDDIAGFVARLGGGESAQSSGGGGSELAAEYSNSEEYSEKLEEVAAKMSQAGKRAVYGFTGSKRLILAEILMQL